MDVVDIGGIALFLVSTLAVTFLGLPSIVWSVILGAILISLFYVHWLSVIPFSVLCFFYVLAAIFANATLLRRYGIVKPMLKKLKRTLPTISQTEQEAIDAGDTWWEKELFCGKPDWRKLHQFAEPLLSKDEEAFIDDQVETLCKLINDWQVMFEERNLPDHVWEYLKQERFFGMVIPKRYGGLGFSALGHSTVITKIASRSMSAAVNTMVPNSLGPAELLLHYGTEEQKNYYLPRLAAGDEIPCFALTAPEAGSDAGSLPDHGIVCKGEYGGQEVIGIRLNWDKRYITLAPIATLLGLAFQLYDPDHLLGDKDYIGITLCLVPTDLQGVEVGYRHYPLQLAFMNGPTRGKDVFIPMDWVIGGKDQLGNGWRMLMECLSIGRAISLPALSAACGKITYRYTAAYARLRRQFNTAIASFEGIEEALARIAGNTYQLEACRLMTANAVDQGIKPSIASAIAKYHMTEMSRQVVADAMDVHAGHMVQVGPRNFLANIYFAIPMSVTVEGANILTRNLIIFGQGAIRCHPYLLNEVELISAKDTDLKALDKTLLAHVGFFVQNIAKSFVYGLTGGRFIKSTLQDKNLSALQKQLTRMSTALAVFADASLILLGGSLKRRERLSARLGDVMSYLYLSSTTLKYYLENKSDTDVLYARWAIETNLHKIQAAFDEIIKNFPVPVVGRLLGWMIFPFGRAYTAPKDTLSKKIVGAMLKPTSFRDRLTKYCYVSPNEKDTTYQLEVGLANVDKMDPIRKKVDKAIKELGLKRELNYQSLIQKAEKNGILSAAEAKQLAEFEALRSEIIKVNEFTFDLKHVIA